MYSPFFIDNNLEALALLLQSSCGIIYNFASL